MIKAFALLIMISCSSQRRGKTIRMECEAKCGSDKDFDYTINNGKCFCFTGAYTMINTMKKK